MATGVRVAITLACTECKRRNYQTQKSKRNSPIKCGSLVSTPLVRPAHGASGDARRSRPAGSVGRLARLPVTERRPHRPRAQQVRPSQQPVKQQTGRRTEKQRAVLPCASPMQSLEGRLADAEPDVSGRRRRHHRVRDRRPLPLGASTRSSVPSSTAFFSVRIRMQLIATQVPRPRSGRLQDLRDRNGARRFRSCAVGDAMFLWYVINTYSGTRTR